jgi:tetrahydromethanopterin S-methyltransferase subunit A
VLDGFVVISLDRRARRIVLRHYDNDLTPRHEMTGVRAESMLLGLLRAGVIADPAHAGYLGGELTKAETALRLGLTYVQDVPLRAPGRPGAAVRPVHEREETPAVTEEPPGPPSMAEFLTAVVTGLGLEGTRLDPDVPLGSQVSVESVRMIELAILLEEELGLDLPPDLDLRRCSPMELYGVLTG